MTIQFSSVCTHWNNDIYIKRNQLRGRVHRSGLGPIVQYSSSYFQRRLQRDIFSWKLSGFTCAEWIALVFGYSYVSVYTVYIICVEGWKVSYKNNCSDGIGNLYSLVENSIHGVHCSFHRWDWWKWNRITFIKCFCKNCKDWMVLELRTLFSDTFTVNLCFDMWLNWNSMWKM